MVKEALVGKSRDRIRHGTLLWTFVCLYAATSSVSALQYSFHVQEELSPGALVGRINTSPGVSYTFEGNPSRFTLNSQTGEITTALRIDRESLSSNPINLRVRTSSSPPSIDVIVHVDDINDNPPEFPSSDFLVSIFENVPVDSVYSIDPASDRDAAENGTIDYSIISGNDAGKFKLGRNTTECGGYYLCIITQGSLDREDVSVYELNISASDRGKPSLHAYCLVNITIVDLNDNSPVFTRNLYNASVDENTPAGVEILAVTATDKDQGSNGEIIYYFDDTDSVSKMFDLNSTTGVIRTRQPLDYETREFYTFDVLAKDQPEGVQPKTDRTKVEITVRDINDHEPQIQVFYANPNVVPTEVLENADIGTLIATVRVKDLDDTSSPNGQINMSVSNANGSFNLAFIGSSPQAEDFYYLETSTPLDRERFASYNITVTARDNGNPSLNSSVQVFVSVIDVNDEVPTFAKPSYLTSISEIAQNGSTVYQMKAFDSDTGINGKISYSILSGNALHWFQINSVSGLITTAGPLDREHLQQVSLTVLAKDNGVPPLNSTTVVTVTIDDFNDNQPTFSQDIYNETLAENLNPGTTITMLHARDDDTGDNGNVTYTIDSSSKEILDTFSITPWTGVLATKVKLDREVKGFYIIPIKATDHGIPPLSSRTFVHLHVTDVNDNPPKFYPVTYVESVLTNTQPRVITQVTATDADSGTNGKIIYVIASGDYGKFSIDSSTGEIKTLTPLDSQVLGFYRLNITAQDIGGLYAEQPATVEVTVQGQSDDPPKFEYSIYNFSVYENVPSGTYVGKVIATTKANNNSIQYSIVSGDPHNLFLVDSAGGIIMVDGHVDREVKDKYSLSVLAKVGTLRPLSATTSVYIDVLDRNDNPPVFKHSSAQVTIDATWPVGKNIYLASASDKDAGLNGVVHYQLTSDGNRLFKVNMTSGMVSLARKITSIDDSVYMLQVSASDQGAPPLHAAFMLTVNIVTNHPPRFSSPSHVADIPRNLPVGKQFLPVVAVDPDTGNNGRLAYSIVRGNEEGLFGISPEGLLYVTKQLNQAKRSTQISVNASDNGTPPLSGSVSVTINIQDSTKHQGMFVNDTFAFAVMENQLPGTNVGQLLLKADDSLKHRKIDYSLVDAQGDFAIDSETGQIITTRMFDREQLVSQGGQNVVIFLAKAVYNDTKAREDSAIVVVTVQDENDNLPEFRRSVVYVTVKESSQVGIVYKVIASDPDEGVNANFNFSIVSGPSPTVFYIDPVSGDLFLNSSLDRETVDHYTLIVQATDTANTSMFSQVCLEIIVGDANDNEPEFNNTYSTVNVSENLALSSQIAVVHATDRDEGVNSEIAYTITSGNLEAVFDINHLTGEVFLIKPLDFERTRKYSLNITADDRGSPAKSSVSWLTVNVLDDNDNAPVFDNQPTAIHVLENVTVGAQIGQCSATDRDSGENGYVTFSIDSQTPIEEMALEVDPVTCMITTRRQLDRERAPLYKLVIRAMDNGSPESKQLSSTKEITVVIKDVNDNKPRFVTAPAVAVLDNLVANDVVTTLLAKDLDAGTNAQVTYSIKSGATNLFQLNPTTGQLLAKSSLPSNQMSFQLTVSAKDGGVPSLNTDTTLTVFKKGQPNSGPTFTSATYRGSVDENSAKGTSVTGVQASFSPSIPNARIEYYITSDSSNGSFVLNADSGVITTAFELDRELFSTSMFVLKVYAVDLSGPSPRTSSATMEISLVDKNDNNPIFLSSVYRSSVKENLSPGASVVTVSAVDKDDGSNARLGYSIASGNNGNAFQINATTGEITTHKVLNHKSQAKYNLNVTATDNGSPVRHSSCIVIVTVIGANNNAPQFSHPFYSFDVLEGTAVGTVLGTVTASDSDTGSNASISYSITGSHQDVFSVDPMSGSLKVSKLLDRETIEVYILNVSASDSGDPSRSAHVEVYVNVLDRNDNAPQFKPSVYSASVSEAAGTHSSIVTVSATDKDFGTNALLTYTILSGNNDRTFSIYPNGTIYNIKEFDREEKSSYFLTIMARDQAVPVAAQLSSTATVTVNIADVNDNSPYFISSNVTHVSEHATTGDIVTTVLVADLDSGSNSKITFSLVKVDALAPFSLGASDGILRVSGSLDREVRDRYVVKVIATDQGIPVRRAELKMTIIVDDYNDHAPAFQPGPSEVRVDENISIGSEVTRLSATDGDQGSNAEVRYGIVAGNENGTFEMNSKNGILSTIRSLDRETTPKYTLVIRASDLGVPSQFTDKTLEIVLLDINDNTPTFSEASYTRQVPENYLEPSVITVKAVDNDEGRNGSVTYDIIHGNDGDVFTIDSQTGQIGLRIALDREKQAEYTLRVQAADGGTPPRVGETKVIVKVTDENDNPPVFQPASLRASVKENAASGTSVLQVSATDADAGINGKITYSLAMSFDLFKIDSDTGEITTTAPLNREVTPLYKLEVLATDGGTSSRQGQAELVVTVEDVNDYDPVFGSSQYTATVARGAPPGTFVVMVSAADEDIGPNTESEYTITSGSSAVFTIAPRTGIITVSQSVPSNELSYSFTVKAANLNAPQRSDTTNVQINVVSGSFPVFQHQDQSVRVSELAPVGTILVTVNATGHTAYFIAAGNVGDVFELDKVRGELKIKSQLDYEQQKNYTVVIGAKDGSSQPLSGFVTIHVEVIDENDNSPVFNQSIYRADIQEELPVNTTVLWVSASDADSAANAEVEYKLVPGNSQASSAFSVSAKTGRVSTKVQLDHEKIAVYTFKVRGEDVKNRSMASEAVVVVNVQDINDNSPVFEDPLTASVYENVSVSSLVAVLNARDADTQIGSRLQFGFAAGGNPDGAFSLDTNSGRLTVQKALNREEKSQYTLKVTVSDSQHTTTSNFTVIVLDVNDSPPRFLSNPLTHQIREKLPIGAAAMNVSAVDDDVGTNAEILYSILPSPASDTFTIDRQTGVLRLEKVLVYKKPSAAGNENFYNVTVRARNSYPPFDEETVQVIVEVTDINDHAPLFTAPSYNFFAISGTPAGVTVGRVEAVDDQDTGANALVRYDAVSGNGTSWFNIDQGSGNVTVARRLDSLGLFYLRVRAQDSGQPAKETFASLYVEVVEINSNAPKFPPGQYQAPVRETASVGEEVLKVTATDGDTGTNGQVFYHIESSNPPGFFGIGRKNGSIFVEKPLDYEFSKEFVLSVVATDGGRIPRSATVTVRITLSDANDNRPVFTRQEYRGYIAENTAPGALITAVTASDPDQDDDGRVVYSITNAELLGSFEINPTSGEIKSKVTFDYEVQQLYELTILAKDQATPPLESQPKAKVFVHVTSVNEFTPRFNKSLFQASVAENAPIGQSVSQIYATDQDQGPDGEVVYLLVGESNNLGFSLDRSTGVLSVSGKLDSEQAGIVTLRVLAKNALQTSVTPDTSDLATVIVTVTDANDAPRFLKSVYYVRVQEEANPNQFVTNVTAVDDDFANQPKEARIEYKISAGNTGGAFKIDQMTGTIRTTQRLDRETIPQYRLTITATDQGVPPMSGNATVIVNLDDINDNPPRLPVNFTGMVKENKPAGTVVVTLQPQDGDVDPNRGPYIFTISGTNYGKFQLNSASGEITTTAELDREAVSSYTLSIKISDGGSPQQSAVSNCRILVEDVNDNPPRSTKRVVHVNSLNSFASGLVANVQPDDPDVNDVLTCKILQNSDGLFSFLPRSCNLITNNEYGGSGKLDLVVNASDGRSAVSYDVQVRFVAYNSLTVNNSITVRVREANPEKFLSQSYQNFLNAINLILPQGYLSQLFSVKSVPGGFVDLSVAAKRTDVFKYMSREALSDLLSRNKADLERNGKVQIENVDYTPCTASSPCQHGGECTSYIQTLGTTTTVDSVPVIFLSVDYDWRFKCVCKPGYIGKTCEISEKGCDSKPCKNGATCVEKDYSYECRCPAGFNGATCENDINECAENPCKNNGRCENLYGSYKCHCKPGYLGANCSSGFDFCQVSSLTNSWAQPKCTCDSGKACQCSCIGFESVSYLTLPTLESLQQGVFNNITFEFSTSKSDGLLLYNTDGKYRRDSDFIAIQIIRGKIHMSFNLGYARSAVVVEHDKTVDDGKWHRVTAIRNGKVSTCFWCDQQLISPNNFNTLSTRQVTRI